ncbi:MAG: V-type ATP synthase subunit B [Candidatus Thorarchaeota archaeon]
MNTSLESVTYQTVERIQGPLLFLNNIELVKFEEMISIEMFNGEIRQGQVLQADPNLTIIQVFEGTELIDKDSVKVTFSQDVFKLGVAEAMLGRRMNGRGIPIDGQGEILPEAYLEVNGNPINPAERIKPGDFIETGISSIDMLNSLVLGQKLPIFSGAGLPTKELAAQIATQARIKNQEAEFAVIFGAMGITERDGRFFQRSFENAKISNLIFFSNYASDSIIERLLIPRIAMTVAEFLAFEKGYQSLVILTDMLNYAEALREVSAAREEFPGRLGYPGYLYTDLATIYERVGRIISKHGSVTLFPVLTMPNDDITHPVPDLTGYITEGQIFLDRNLFNLGYYPPINPLPSLSRLMNAGIGEGKTRADHREIADQLYAFYAKGVQLRQLVAIAGEESLSDRDKRFLNFADEFEQRFIHQGQVRRTIENSLDLSWELLRTIPKDELTRIKKEDVDHYY